MADLYPVLRKAIGQLDHPDEAARYELYERARRSVINRLRDADPPWSEADVDAQLEALHAAVTRVENELADKQAPRVMPRRGAPIHQERPADRRVASDRAGEARPRRHRTIVALAGALAVILVAGFGAYHFLSRDRTARAPVDRSAAAKSSTPAREVATADATPVPAGAPYVLRRQRVYYRTTQPAGAVIIARNQRFLYLVLPNQVAIRYAIAVGPPCAGIAGLFHVTDKVNLAGSGQTDQAGASFVPPALYFGDRQAVHGTQEPAHIGQAASAGCFHLWGEDAADLYGRVPLDERVVVAN